MKKYFKVASSPSDSLVDLSTNNLMRTLLAVTLKVSIDPMFDEDDDDILIEYNEYCIKIAEGVFSTLTEDELNNFALKHLDLRIDQYMDENNLETSFHPGA